MGAGLGLLILHYTWRSANKGRGKKDDFLSAALVGSIYFGAALTAIFYPYVLFLSFFFFPLFLFILFYKMICWKREIDVLVV